MIAAMPAELSTRGGSNASVHGLRSVVPLLRSSPLDAISLKGKPDLSDYVQLAGCVLASKACRHVALACHIIPLEGSVRLLASVACG